MSAPAKCRRRRLPAVLLLAALVFLPGTYGQDAPALRTRHASLREQLENSAFQRPLVLESTQSDRMLRGDIHAVIAQPYRVVGAALSDMGNWCDILMLHLNVKDCRMRAAGGRKLLRVFIGRKFDQPLADAYRVDFTYRIAADDPGYLQVQLSADSGPLGTKDYRIALEAIPLDATHSFVRMSYSYRYGLMAEIALHLYLTTVGRGKVGFSVVGRNPDGTPIYVDNERGVVERNTMRYYLAVEAYLSAQALSPAEQTERRLNNWFAAIERYPRQLHEMEREDYLRMKRGELERLRAASSGPETD